MRLLLISNSTNAGESYLEYPMPYIQSFLGEKKMRCVFIPYAGVSINFNDYTKRVKDRFEEIGQDIESVHNMKDPVEGILQADTIVVGGGNTFQLVKMIEEQGLMKPVREKVKAGVPYIGWSAGANMACPTIKTTNDMPIVEPASFEAFNLVPFQINPHYLDANPDGHAGETREARIEEFIIANPGISVLGLREGTLLRFDNNSLSLLGRKNARLFKSGSGPVELSSSEDLSFLMD